MRDGTRIAVDVHLPRGAATRLPTIVRQTRYHRRFEVQPALRPILGQAMLDPMNAPMRELFVARGYAWVDVDARGSGASFGERPWPWFHDGEVADGAEIVQWIVEQPWSNGRVGSTGVSYEGTTADFLASTGHPAVRAIAPRFALWDVYADVAFPGGLHAAHFTRAWEAANAALDANDPGAMVAGVFLMQAHGLLAPGRAQALDRPALRGALRRFFRWALRGVAPVEADRDRALLRAAIASHGENFNVDDAARHLVFRDDVPPNAPIPDGTVDDFSPHAARPPADGVAVLSYGGWFDGAYANGAVKRFAARRAHAGEASLLLGPWIHGGQLVMDPAAPGTPAAFDHATELLRFFDRHLLDEPPRSPPPAAVRWFAMNGGGWRSSPTWPPAGTRALTLHPSPTRTLAREPAPAGAKAEGEVDLSVAAGTRSRWRTLLCPFLRADGRGHSRSGYWTWDGEPLADALFVVGHPVLELALASSVPDGAILAYLDDVAPDGSAVLLTEGELRTVHRTRLELHREGPPTVVASHRRADALALAPGERAVHAIELLPLATTIRPGHRVRLRLAGSDRDHFTTPGDARGVRWSIDLAASRLFLPILPRA
jgi:putative CocE/NonD family hydrolase